MPTSLLFVAVEQKMYPMDLRQTPKRGENVPYVQDHVHRHHLGRTDSALDGLGSGRAIHPRPIRRGKFCRPYRAAHSKRHSALPSAVCPPLAHPNHLSHSHILQHVRDVHAVHTGERERQASLEQSKSRFEWLSHEPYVKLTCVQVNVRAAHLTFWFMVPAAGIEPTTSWFEAKRSIQLSYAGGIHLV